MEQRFIRVCRKSTYLLKQCAVWKHTAQSYHRRARQSECPTLRKAASSFAPAWVTSDARAVEARPEGPNVNLTLPPDVDRIFNSIDKDHDGMLSKNDVASLMLAMSSVERWSSFRGTFSPQDAITVLPPTSHSSTEPMRELDNRKADKPMMLSWDLQALESIRYARENGGIVQCLASLVVKKLGGHDRKQDLVLSDFVWASVGMAAAFAALSILAQRASSLPLVGVLHEKGLPLLLGSFGTSAVLLFGRPEAEPVRLWNVVCGQVGCTAIGLTVLQLVGNGLTGRSLAMATGLLHMMWTDSLHPPGGALVLMLMDNAMVQSLQWWYLLYPSLIVTLLVLMPLSAVTCWLRRNCRFGMQREDYKLSFQTGLLNNKKVKPE